MYRNTSNNQLDISDFILPFGGDLKEDNRWIVLREMIDWDIIDEEYSQNIENKDVGQETLCSGGI